MSTPNWRDEIHKITAVVKAKVNARVTRYRVSDKADVPYSKNDLQAILEDPEPPPQAKAKGKQIRFQGGVEGILCLFRLHEAEIRQ